MCLLHRVAACLEDGSLQWANVAEMANDGFLCSFGWCPEEPCVVSRLLRDSAEYTYSGYSAAQMKTRWLSFFRDHIHSPAAELDDSAALRQRPLEECL